MPNQITPVDTHVEQESHSFNPVYVDTNGNLYTITESILSELNQPRAMKSTDDGATWSEMDASNRPGTSAGQIGDLESGWITQEPGYLTFTWARTNPTYSRFRTSDHPTTPDTWEDNDREQTGSGTGTPQFMSHTSPTDRTYQWLFWSNGSNISYNNRPLGADTTESSTQTLQTSAACPMAWLDYDNISWVVYKASGQLHYRTLTSGGTLSASTRIDDNGVNAVAIPHCRPVIYQAGADKVVTCVFANGAGDLIAVDIVNGTPGSEQTITTDSVELNPPNTGNDGAIVTADVDGTTMHVFWADDATGDLYHSEREYGGSWSTPDAITDVNTGLTTGIYWLYCKTVEFPDSTRAITLRYSDGFDLVNEVNDIFVHLYPLASVITVNIGQATQPSTAQPITLRQDQLIDIGLATETDAARLIDLGGESELDEALPITASLGSGFVNPASESDLAQPVTAHKTKAVGLASETDTAQAVTSLRMLAVGLASETDEQHTIRRWFATDLTIRVGATSVIGLVGQTRAGDGVTVGDSRSGIAIGPGRSGVQVGPSRIDREV